MADMTLEEALAAAALDEELIEPVNDILCINPETRVINVPDSEKLFGTRQDMGAERKYFKCPRIVGDNIDLSEHRIFVNYVPSKQDGSYDSKEDVQSYWCKDLAVEGDFITFSWKLSENVTRNAGYIAFAVCAKTIDGNGNLETKWNTTVAIGVVLDTLPYGEDVLNEYPDIIMQLLERMDELGTVKPSVDISKEIAILEEQTITLSLDSIGSFDNEIYLETTIVAEIFAAGDILDVMWNGVNYSCVASGISGDAYIGNLSIAYDDKEDTGEPFLITCMDDGFMVLMGSNIEGSTIKQKNFSVGIVKREGEIVQIDENFILDHLAVKETVKKLSEDIADLKENGTGGNITVDGALSETSTNPVQNKVVCNALKNKADSEDVYVELETDTASASEIMMLSDEGIAVASVEEYSFTSSDNHKNWAGKTVSCSPGSDVPIYVTSVKIACSSRRECMFSVWEYTKKYPDSPANHVYILTKIRDCGSSISNNDLAEITFPNGERIEPNQVMLATAPYDGATGGPLKYGTKDYDNSAIIYYTTITADAQIGDTFETDIPGDWTGVFTTTYTLEPPENTGGETETTYTITNNLENASNSNAETSIVEGSSYTATITANSGYDLETVTVTMGGVDVTTTAYSNGVINIGNVTGDLVITVTTTAQSTGTTYTVTNLLTNVSTSNVASNVVEGSAYVATLNAYGGYVLSSVIVTMGGTDITASSYSAGRISIPSVSGNITITAIAESTGGGSASKRKIKDVIPEMLADIKGLKTAVGNSSSNVSNSRSTRKSINKYFTLTVDDVERSFLTIADRLIGIGFYPALALKMESINNGGITWEEVRTLQNMGFEIAFHGMLHGHTPAGTAPNNDEVMIADIAEYKALCKDNGIDIVGYCGPNHYPLPVDAFREFEWARSPYGLTTYGADYRLTDSFASLIVWSCELTGSATMEETKANMIAHADRLADNQYLTPMCHSQNIVAYIDDYMEVFNAWIEKGLAPMRCRDAVKHSLWECGGIGQNSTFEIQAGTATAPYCVIAGNGIMRSNQGTTESTI